MIMTARLRSGREKHQAVKKAAGQRMVTMRKQPHGGKKSYLEKEGENMKIEKIRDKEISLDIKGQGCGNDCFEEKVWVGATNGNTKGCVIYENVYTPKTTSWW